MPRMRRGRSTWKASDLVAGLGMDPLSATWRSRLGERGWTWLVGMGAKKSDITK